MKETIYRCNRCKQLISGTAHRIDATDENGEKTKYGALFDNMDFCEECMSHIIEKALNEIDNEEPAARQQECESEKTPQIQNAEPFTYQCSKVIKRCAYSEKAGAALTCNYIGIEGHRRGCEPEQCDKFKEKSGRGRKVAKGKGTGE